MEIPETIEISGDDAVAIVSWWRGANEAPGGCSSLDAIKGMAGPVYNMALKLREQGYQI